MNQLPEHIAKALAAYCAEHGEDPAAVIADAVSFHLDDLGERFDVASSEAAS